MSLAFALGMIIGVTLVVFGRNTSAGRRLLLELHLRVALLRRWLRGKR